MSCRRCNKPTSLTCGQCYACSYCSADCQRKDWRFHKEECRKGPQDHPRRSPAALFAVLLSYLNRDVISIVFQYDAPSFGVKPLFSFGGIGESDGQFGKQPRDLCLSHDNEEVVVVAANDINVFSVQDGRFLRSATVRVNQFDAMFETNLASIVSTAPDEIGVLMFPSALRFFSLHDLKHKELIHLSSANLFCNTIRKTPDGRLVLVSKSSGDLIFVDRNTKARKGRHAFQKMLPGEFEVTDDGRVLMPSLGLLEVVDLRAPPGSRSEHTTINNDFISYEVGMTSCFSTVFLTSHKRGGCLLTFDVDAPETTMLRTESLALKKAIKKKLHSLCFDKQRGQLYICNFETRIISVFQ
jgi:hypothetical protein